MLGVNGISITNRQRSLKGSGQASFASDTLFTRSSPKGFQRVLLLLSGWPGLTLWVSTFGFDGIVPVMQSKDPTFVLCYISCRHIHTHIYTFSDHRKIWIYTLNMCSALDRRSIHEDPSAADCSNHCKTIVLDHQCHHEGHHKPWSTSAVTKVF